MIQIQLPPRWPLPPTLIRSPILHWAGVNLSTVRQDQKSKSSSSSSSSLSLSSSSPLSSSSLSSSMSRSPSSESSPPSSWSHRKSLTTFSSAAASFALITQLVIPSVDNGVFFALRRLTALRTRSCRTPEPGTTSLKSSICKNRDVRFGKIGTCTGADTPLLLSLVLGACPCVPLPLSPRLLLRPFPREPCGGLRAGRRLVVPSP